MAWWANKSLRSLLYTWPKSNYEKNFKDKVFKIKKLINIWSSRGLSLYGKVTVIKSLVLPKLVYISSLLPTPQAIIKEVNQLIFNFLRKGRDKVTRLSTINTYEEGGLKMTDLGSMIKALRLTWLKRVFSSNKGTWKSYLRYILKDYGGFLLFSCNYNIKDLSISSQFYKELIQWWSEFRDMFAEEKDWRYIIWNNYEIRVNNKPVFMKIMLYSEFIVTMIFFLILITFNLLTEWRETSPETIF